MTQLKPIHTRDLLDGSRRRERNRILIERYRTVRRDRRRKSRVQIRLNVCELIFAEIDQIQILKSLKRLRVEISNLILLKMKYAQRIQPLKGSRSDRDQIVTGQVQFTQLR